MTAISYPTVTVINGDATWDSMNGEYGSGSAVVGDFGSEIVLDGSVEDIAINMQFIPCLLYTSPSPRDRQKSRMPSSA